MLDTGSWIGISLLIYCGLTMNLKGRPAAAALWAYCWLIAAFSAINPWHMYHLDLSYQRLEPDPGAGNILSRHAESLYWCLATTIILVVYPVVFYWWVARTDGSRSSASRTP